MNAAIAKLLASAGEPQDKPAAKPTSQTPVPEAAPRHQSNETRNNELDDENEPVRKRIIQPITNPKDKPDLDKLLAAEEAKVQASSEPQLPSLPAKHEAANNKTDDAPTAEAAKDTPADNTKPTPPKSTVFDPSNISL